MKKPKLLKTIRTWFKRGNPDMTEATESYMGESSSEPVQAAVATETLVKQEEAPAVPVQVDQVGDKLDRLIVAIDSPTRQLESLIERLQALPQGAGEAGEEMILRVEAVRSAMESVAERSDAISRSLSDLAESARRRTELLEGIHQAVGKGNDGQLALSNRMDELFGTIHGLQEQTDLSARTVAEMRESVTAGQGRVQESLAEVGQAVEDSRNHTHQAVAMVNQAITDSREQTDQAVARVNQNLSDGQDRTAESLTQIGASLASSGENLSRNMGKLSSSVTLSNEGLAAAIARQRKLTIGLLVGLGVLAGSMVALAVLAAVIWL